LQVLVPSAQMYGFSLTAVLRRLARSTPSSSAHRSSGAAIGRPRPGSCQVPTDPEYRTRVRGSIHIPAYRDRSYAQLAGPPPKRVRLAVIPGSGSFARSPAFANPLYRACFLLSAGLRG